MSDLLQSERPQREVPTYTRVWEYRWVIRGIPNGPTFWRPIEGRAAVVFGVVMLINWMLFRRLHIRPGLYGGMLLYLGIPFLAAWYVTRARLGGKRLDRWLADRLGYLWGSKVYNRFEAVPADERPISMDSPVLVDRSRG